MTQDTEIDIELITWAGKNLLDGCHPDTIIQHLTSRINDRAEATAIVEKVVQNLSLLGARDLSLKYRKLSNMVNVLAQQLRYSKVADGVPVETNITPERFFKEYYFCNRPVIVRGLMNNWKALKNWSLDFFEQKYGNFKVEVVTNRNSDPNYEERYKEHCEEMLLSEFIQQIRSGVGNDMYLIARNRLLDRSQFSDLLNDFDHPAGFLKQKSQKDVPYFWLGGAGTITALHHDVNNSFFGVVLGRKHFKLIPSLEINSLYNDRICYTAFNMEQPDFNTYPLARNVLTLDVVVYPGDFLLIPIGWWHHVKSLDPCISFTFQDFDIPDIDNWVHYNV